MIINECDPDRIETFFRREGGTVDSTFSEHLETCVDCRKRFDDRAASSDQWQRAADLLRPTEFDSASIVDYSAGGAPTVDQGLNVSVRDVLDSLAPSDDPMRMGRLGPYEVTGVIGVGGMGVVLKAVDPSLDRIVAIKVMSPQFANNERARQRFSREARAAAAVLHPNVIPIHAVDETGKVPYLVMSYVRGDSLQKRLDSQGTLELAEVLRIGSQIAAGLAAAHEQGLVHRDIKPENILLEGGVERVTITDFGLARAVDDNTVTQAGTIAGTPMYMSPEQARGEQVDQHSDLFSLGSVLYALCTGRPPYRADTSYGVMRLIIDEHPTPLRQLTPKTPEWMARLVENLMERDKAKRLAPASRVHQLLETCLSHVQKPETATMPGELVQLLDRSEETEAVQPPTKQAPTKSGRFLAIAVLVSVIGLLAIGGLFQWMRVQNKKKLADADKNLRQYLRSGEFDEHPLNDVRTLLDGGEQGREYLKALDEDFDKILFAEGEFQVGDRSVVGLVTPGKNGRPELDIRVRGKQFAGSMGTSFNGVLVQSISISKGVSYRRNVTYIVSVIAEPFGLTSSYGLEPGGRYRIEIPLADSLDQKIHWATVWRSAQLLNTEEERENIIKTTNFVGSVDGPLDTYKGFHGDYPTTEQGLKQLAVRGVNGRAAGIMKDSPTLTKDRWGNELGYRYPGKHGDEPDVWSNGPDGVSGTVDDIRSWELPKDWQVLLPKPELNLVDKAVGTKSANTTEYFWKVMGQGLGEMQIKLLLARNGEAEIVRQFKFGRRSSSFTSDIRLLVSDKSNLDKTSTVDAILRVDSEDLKTTGESETPKLLPLTLDTSFGVNVAPKNPGELWSSDTQVLYYMGKWSGDLEYNPTLEGMIDATNRGATFLFVTLDWKTAAEASLEEEAEVLTSDDESSEGLVQRLTKVHGDLPKKLGQMLSEAAGVPNGQWDSFARSPTASTKGIQGEPLSLVLWGLRPDKASKENAAALKDFQYIGDRTPKPVDLNRAMMRSKSRGYHSMLQPEYLSKLEYKVSSGEVGSTTLHGSVRFHADGLYAGEVRFVVGVADNDELDVEEFNLPNYGVTIVKQADGTWKRKTDNDSKDQVSHSDREAIQGVWQMTFMEEDGRVIPQQVVEELRFKFKGDSLTILPEGERRTFVLNEETSPKMISIVGDDAKSGIYELSGDALRLCASKTTRPKAFNSRDGAVLIRFKRVSGTDPSSASSSYFGERLEIQSIQRQPNGKLRITFCPLMETMWSCPGANLERLEDGVVVLTFVRAMALTKRPKVDLPSTKVQDELAWHIEFDSKDKEVFIKTPEGREKILAIH